MQRIKKAIVYSTIFLVITLGVLLFTSSKENQESYNIDITTSYQQADMIQVYYGVDANFTETQSSVLPVSTINSKETYTFSIPKDMKVIRIDFGGKIGNEITIQEIKITSGKESITLTTQNIQELWDGLYKNGLGIQEENQILQVLDADPYLVFDIEELMKDAVTDSQVSQLLFRIVFAILLGMFITYIIYRYIFLKEIIGFIRDIIKNRILLFSLAKNDFKVKYAGSYFGIVWAFVQPICTIAVFWFVFEMGFRSGAVSDVPFALWLSAGLIPWFFFSDAWNGATNTFMEYSYLVKKVVFKIEILPIVKLLSALFVHLFFIAFLCILFVINKVPITINVLGSFYYMLCLSVFVIGLSFITSSIVIFFKDLSQIINIILQFGMWLTPIMWQTSMFSEGVVNVMRINPMFYIIEGYRSCFIPSEPIPTIAQGVYFWFITILVFLFGISLFRKLKPHFADVL